MICYYFPGQKNATAATFAAAGLSYALDPPVPVRDCSVWANGPDGGGGAIGIVSPGDPKRGYYPDRQRWRKIPGCDVWAGIWTDQPLLSDGLARRRLLPGEMVEMADGREWLVPVARRWVVDEDGGGWCCALPERSRLGDDGQWTRGDVIEQYASLWRIASDWDTALNGAATESGEDGVTLATFTFDKLHESALTVLGYNYRIGAVEADLLGVLSDAHCQSVLMATIDFAARVAFNQKKREAASAGASSSPGRADGSPATDRP